MYGTALPTRPALHAEWIKIRSLRGTVGALTAIFVATAGIQALSAAAGTVEDGSLGDDPLLAAFFGINFGQIAAMAFGASAFAAEFHNGGLRVSLASVPNRTRFYLSKAAVVGALALAVGLAAGLASFAAGQALGGASALGWGTSGAGRAIVGSGLYLMVMALFAAGLTAVLRSGTLVLGLLIPLVLVVSFVMGGLVGGPAQYLPDRAGQMVLRSVEHGALGPWTGLGVSALWALAALAGGCLAVRRRDA
ncbi:ABC transporter permease [Streptomyces sp. 2P-4]|uniref:ABC transporter permease n=1 Tax=Streptomyces sp. 2P-4 TaxID=2931974 RepID=UPI00254025B1|nr:ABC transporter permease [Streptomyces sp. 2P-4]